MARSILALMICCVASSPANAQQGFTSVGDWIINVERSAFDNNTTVIAITEGKVSVLALRCLQGEITFAWGNPVQFVGRYKEGDIGQFKFRVDTGAIMTENGIAINDKIFQISSSASTLDDMTKGKRISILTNVKGITLEDSYSLRGGNRIVGEIRKACPE